MITYAEITIHKEAKRETMFEYFSRVINESKPETTDTIIILFDDTTIVDVKKYESKCIIKKGPNGFNTLSPIYFDIEKQTFFASYNTVFNTTLFSCKSNLKDSPYNCIYYTSCGVDVFGISRIKSSDESPRFLVAYNSMFDQNHVIHLVNYILSNQVKT